ncbi:MAG: thiol-disulfide isomerase/thioredoxin [Marivirga sp.]|jgi:thiol-disulfide isomerase/thioredoxin
MKKFAYYTLVLLSCLTILSCNSNNEERTALAGLWIGKIIMQEQEMPFKLLIEEDGNDQITATVINGVEKIVLDEITRTGDSLHIPMNVFDISLDLLIKKNTLTGSYTKHYEENYVLPVTFSKGNERFTIKDEAANTSDFGGTWEVTFIYPEEQDTTKAVGIFEQNGTDVTGTFLTPLGDYRYLAGVVDGNELKLSTFDGNHAFLFKAIIQDDGTLKGDFYSGKEWYESWSGFRNLEAALPSPDSLTYLKKGYDRVYFEFPDLAGNNYKFPNDSLKGKVVILQIFGTWCPNCMDETKFLSDWYEQNKEKDVAIIGLAYEAKDDFDYAKGRVEKMINKWNVGYNFLIAGHNDKEAASQSLPMLNKIISFPTMVIIDKNGEVARIHTGFSGPGTGKYYDDFVAEFTKTMDALLQ